MRPAFRIKPEMCWFTSRVKRTVPIFPVKTSRSAGWSVSGLLFSRVRGQVAVSKDHAVDGVDFFADIGTDIFSQFRRSGSVRRRRFKNVWLSTAKTLLETPPLFRCGPHEMYVHIISPGNISYVEMCLSGGLETAKLTTKLDLQLAVFHLDFLEIIIIPVPIQPCDRGHLLGRERRYGIFGRFFCRSRIGGL